MQSITGEFRVHFRYEVHFADNLFGVENPTFRETLTKTGQLARVLFVIEKIVDDQHLLRSGIEAYFSHHSDFLALAGPALILPGGEQVKNDSTYVGAIHQAINDAGLDRHSYLAVIGGGALLDVAGFAAATAHRGVRLLRIPTTTLSQCDSGVGVKNGINALGKKNFTGTFAPPWAVFNDLCFLDSLPDREWRAGIAPKR